MPDYPAPRLGMSDVRPGHGAVAADLHRAARAGRVGDGYGAMIRAMLATVAVMLGLAAWASCGGRKARGSVRVQPAPVAASWAQGRAAGAKLKGVRDSVLR